MASTGLDLSLTFGDPISIILGIVFIILGIIVLITAKGLLSNTSDDLQYSIFGRLEIMGIVDMLSVLILILIGEPALGVVYFILAPFTAHAIANAYWKKEDRENNMDLMTVEEEVDENHPFIHPKEKMQALESEDSEKLKADDRFSVTTIEINEDE